MKTNIRKRIIKFLDDIEWLFQIQNFDRSIIYASKDYDDDEKESNRVCDITLREEYQTIIITIYPAFFSYSLEKQRRYLLHELFHTITNPLYFMFLDFIDGKSVTKETIEKALETSNSKVTMIVDGLLRGRMRYACDAYSNYLKPTKKNNGKNKNKRKQKKKDVQESEGKR